MNRRHEKYATAIALIELLADRFPQSFAVWEARRRPLAIGIREQIIAAVGGAMERRELSGALGFYCRATGYLVALQRGDRRVNLDGSPADLVTPEHAQGAADELARRFERTRAARKRPPVSVNGNGSHQTKRLGLGRSASARPRP